MTFIGLLDEIVCRLCCEITAENNQACNFPDWKAFKSGVGKTYPKLGGGERDRSRRSLSRSFFDCFIGFGLLHTGVEMGRFGDSEYDRDRDFDLDRARGDFERLLLRVRDRYDRFLMRFGLATSMTMGDGDRERSRMPCCISSSLIFLAAFFTL